MDSNLILWIAETIGYGVLVWAVYFATRKKSDFAANVWQLHLCIAYCAASLATALGFIP